MSMIDQVMNNRNLLLDKNILKPNPDKPRLAIYLGSDFGFCSNYNSQINAEIERDPNSEKILIGKKLTHHASHVILRITQEELDTRTAEVEQILKNSIIRRQHSQIDIVYIRYINTAENCKEIRQIFPMEIPKGADPADYRDDFMIEGDVETLMTDMLISWLIYQIQIMRTSGYASENILRQNTTSESLKKIEEREEEQKKEERREKRAKEFSKVIENYQKKAY
jgi:F0F1-type ATP synthase gamma subunit